MEESKMKNMIVLKDLPSNIVDEAFVILKQNKKIKKEDYANNVVKDKPITTKYGSRDYMVREAEMVINNYLSDIENEKKLKEYNVKQLEKKYKRMKKLAYILGVTTFLSTFIHAF